MAQRSRLNISSLSKYERAVHRHLYIYARPHAIIRPNKLPAEQTKDSNTDTERGHSFVEKLPQSAVPTNSARTWNDIGQPSDEGQKSKAERRVSYIKLERVSPVIQAAVQPTTHAIPEPTSRKRITKVRPRTLLGGAVATLLLVSLFTFGAHAYNKPTVQVVAGTMSHASSDKANTPNLASAAPNLGLPVRLEIPKIQVDANILYLGIASNGAMDAPPDISHVGWYKYGPLPGNMGSAVIVGHLDGPEGQPGVFSNLDKLQPGDSISVVDSKLQTSSFVVRAIQTYNQTNTPSNLFTSAGGSHLNLITCTGTWDAAQHRYLQRLVVFADKV